MTDFVISAGRSPFYPLSQECWGQHFVDNRATFFLEQDFAAMDANAAAIPGLSVTQLSATPVTVGAGFFGAHVAYRANDSSSLSAGCIRSHDMEAGASRWQKIEQSQGVFSWTGLDAWVNTHYAAGRDLLFTLFGTPAWASARPTEVGAYGAGNPGLQAEPADMSKWSTFCMAVATRYLGKIKYYEVWNEPNNSNNGTTTTGSNFFFSGTFAKLSEMTRLASQAIKAVDPTAKIVCAPVTGWTATAGSSAESYFSGMMAASDGAAGVMKDWVDIVGVHLYLPYPNDVTKLPGMIDRINIAKASAGLSGKETWDTESAPINPDIVNIRQPDAALLVQRHLLVSAAKGVARTFYYQLDHSTMGIAGRHQARAAYESMRSTLMSGRVKPHGNCQRETWAIGTAG